MPEAATGQKGAGGQTDTVWDGQTPLADTGRGWSYCCVPLAPWHIWVFHLLSMDFPPLSPTQGRAGLSLGQMKEQWIFRGGRKLLCSYPKQECTSAHIYIIYYIFCELYNICTYICGDLEGTFLWNDQHFLPPQQQLLAQCISALTCRAGHPSPPSDLPSPP